MFKAIFFKRVLFPVFFLLLVNLVFAKSYYQSDAQQSPINDTPSAIVASPDNKHLYATFDLADGIGFFERNVVTGEIKFVKNYFNGVNNITGLVQPDSLVISQDGKFIYIANEVSDSVVVFARDSISGFLTYVETKFNLQEGIGGLNKPTALILSSDDKHLYVAGYDSDSIAVFARDTETGRLSFIGAVYDGDNNGLVDGLNQVNGFAMSSDGNYLYAHSWFDYAVVVFQRNKINGTLTFIEVHKNNNGLVSYMTNPKSMAISPDQKHLYVASNNSDAIVYFSRNQANGKLTFVEAGTIIDGGDGGLIDGLNGANQLWLTNSYLYVSADIDNTVAVYSRNSNSGALSPHDIKVDGQGLIDGLEGARFVLKVDKNIYVAGGSNEDSIVEFSIDENDDDNLVFNDANIGVAQATGLWQNNSIAVTQDNEFIYTAGNFDHSIAQFKREGNELRHIRSYTNNQEGVSGLYGIYSVNLSPDEKYLYATSNHNVIDGAIVLFSRDENNGELTFKQVMQDSDIGVSGLRDAYSSFVLDINNTTKHVYVAGSVSDQVAFLVQTNDQLAFQQAFGDNDGLNSLNSVLELVITPDGKYLYAVSAFSNAVTVIERDVDTGQLISIIQEVVNEGPDINNKTVYGLDEADSVAISPDGKHLYVAGEADDAVAAFSIDADTGELAYIDTIYDSGFSDGLNGATSVQVSTDGGRVLVAGLVDDAVAILARNKNTGELSFEEGFYNNEDGVKLNGPSYAKFSSDGKYVYVAGHDDDSLLLFAPESRLFSDGFE